MRTSSCEPESTGPPCPLPSLTAAPMVVRCPLRRAHDPPSPRTWTNISLVHLPVGYSPRKIAPTHRHLKAPAPALPALAATVPEAGQPRMMPSHGQHVLQAASLNRRQRRLKMLLCDSSARHHQTGGGPCSAHDPDGGQGKAIIQDRGGEDAPCRLQHHCEKPRLQDRLADGSSILHNKHCAHV